MYYGGKLYQLFQKDPIVFLFERYPEEEASWDGKTA